MVNHISSSTSLSLKSHFTFLFYTFCTVGILESGCEDFETASDVHDAVGDLFLEMSESQTDFVNDVCEQLIRMLKV